jgi:hypothetical protein
MDTRFWGPSGWRLLHLITFQAERLDSKNIERFFMNLPYVLPCKYCRASLSDYYSSDPVPKKLAEYPKWLYRIHNCVNNKLRSQNLLDTPNPTWFEIKHRYLGWINTTCSKQRMIGWDFLFSVAYTTPCKSVASSSMANAPPIESLHTPELRNRWGVMSKEERMPYIQTWWSLLPDVLPYKEWTDTWKSSVPTIPDLNKGRKVITAWLFKAEKIMCAKLKENAPHNSYSDLCNELQTFASGCGNSKTRRMKTCRSKKKGRNTFKKRREKLYVATGGYL